MISKERERDLLKIGVFSLDEVTPEEVDFMTRAGRLGAIESGENRLYMLV